MSEPKYKYTVILPDKTRKEYINIEKCRTLEGFYNEDLETNKVILAIVIESFKYLPDYWRLHALTEKTIAEAVKELQRYYDDQKSTNPKWIVIVDTLQIIEV